MMAKALSSLDSFSSFRSFVAKLNAGLREVSFDPGISFLECEWA